jgi:hypothetical protein
MNKFKAIKMLVLIYCGLFMAGTAIAQRGTADLLISFRHIANNKSVVLSDSTYSNFFGEPYHVTRLRYYLSNLHFDGSNCGTTSGQNVFLVDAAAADTLRLQVPAGTYSSLCFTLGVDSLLNCSGAQDGALDPLNGMFWTWNSGYIFFKLEGSSPASVADLHRIEHHIGGYRGPYQAGRNIEVNLEKPLMLKEHSTHQIAIRVNLDRYWNSTHEIKIADTPLIMVPGQQAARSADNFKSMFSIIPPLP